MNRAPFLPRARFRSLTAHRTARGVSSTLALVTALVAGTAAGAFATACGSNPHLNGTPASSPPKGTAQGGGTQGGAAQAGAASAASGPCGALPASVVNAELGTALGGPTEHASGSTTVCDYSSGKFRAVAVISYRRGSDPASFAGDAGKLGAYGASTTSVTGVGDMAMAASIGSGPNQTNTVSAFHSGLEITVSAAAPIDAVESLARRVLEVLSSS